MKLEEIARALLRLYPAAWRVRYGDELLALIDESGLTFRIVLDVVLAAGVEWFRTAAALIRGEDSSGEPPPKLLTNRYIFTDFLPCVAIICATVLILAFAGVPYPNWITWFILIQQWDNREDWFAPRHPSRSARLFVWSYWFFLALGLTILGWGVGSGIRRLGAPEPSATIFYSILGTVLGVGLIRGVYLAYKSLSYNSTWPGLNPRETRSWQIIWFAVIVMSGMADPAGEAFWPWAGILWMSLRPPDGMTRAGMARQRALKEERDRQSPWPQI